MTDFHDFFINSEIDELHNWSRQATELNTVILEASDWGELKRKIGENRKEADILAFRGGDEELNRKAVEEPRLDILLHPEKNRENSGLNHILAEKAAENSVAIGFDFSYLYGSSRRDLVMKDWRKNLKLLEKYDAPYITTTRASKLDEIRAPRDLAALINELGGKGLKSVKDAPSEILERVEKRNSDEFVRPGVEEVGEE